MTIWDEIEKGPRWFKCHPSTVIDPTKHISIEEIIARGRELEAENAALKARCERLKIALLAIRSIENREFGADYSEIDEARNIAVKALAQGEQGGTS